MFTNEFGEEVVDFSIQGAPVEEVPLLTDDPLLDTPAANGGYTFTMALKAGSPAIDAGNPASATPVDQRGATRDGNPDLGAYEVEQ
ncbi:MAG: choice-of-anchor Q domain-containing protein [Bacteroidota bacterium]